MFPGTVMTRWRYTFSMNYFLCITATVSYRPANIIYCPVSSEWNSLDIDVISWQWSKHHLRPRPNPFSVCAWTRHAAILSIRSTNYDRLRIHVANADIGRCWRYRSTGIRLHEWQLQFVSVLCVECPLVAVLPEHFWELLLIPAVTTDTQSPNRFSLLILWK